jgi:brefeldin A-inhibited guanine nucleotide-exchange protein
MLIKMLLFHVAPPTAPSPSQSTAQSVSVPTLAIQTSSAALSPSATVSARASTTQPYLLPTGIVSEDHFFLKWFPILSAFSRVIIDSESVSVRTRTMESLFETLKTAHVLYDIKYWKTIHRSIILPIFEDLHVPQSPKKTSAFEAKDQMKSKAEEEGDKEQAEGEAAEDEAASPQKEGNALIWVQGLRLLVDLFTDCFDSVVEGGGEIIGDGLDLMLAMMKKRDEKVLLSI